MKIRNQFQVVIEDAVDIQLEKHGFSPDEVINDAHNFLSNFVDCRISREDVEYVYDLREAEYVDFLTLENHAFQEKDRNQPRSSV